MKYTNNVFGCCCSFKKKIPLNNNSCVPGDRYVLVIGLDVWPLKNALSGHRFGHSIPRKCCILIIGLDD